MSDLSFAAQAIKDAVLALYVNQPQIKELGWQLDCPTVAAALRAAADQVVPHTAARTDRAATRRKIRTELLAIAAELDGANHINQEDQ